jgi:hypothetical protein
MPIGRRPRGGVFPDYTDAPQRCAGGGETTGIEAAPE